MSYDDKLAAARDRHGRPFAHEIQIERRTPRSPYLRRLDQICQVEYTPFELERQARALRADYIDSLSAGAASLREHWRAKA